MNKLRKELPELPEKMRALPVDTRGYPVPWFVAWVKNGEPVAPGHGTPDFRIIAPGAIATAHNRSRCWICGGRLGRFRTFTVGPMCAVNRTSAEPPSHLECSDFAARACPFLVRPHARRRDIAEDLGTIEPPGIALMRNPGVTLVWTTERYHVFRAHGGGALFDIGVPVTVRWYSQGRLATRAEIIASIESGLPPLRAAAADEGHAAINALDMALSRALDLVPA